MPSIHQQQRLLEKAAIAVVKGFYTGLGNDLAYYCDMTKAAHKDGGRHYGVC